ISPEDRIWMAEDFAPRSYAGGVRFVAIIVPRNRLAGLVIEDIIERIEPLDVDIRIFGELSEAKRWMESM
ncbi:MAG TPA: hypothetical protein VEC36_04075, partial [Patescibacteria group bacterium]|nr:hypothetical protein [Patescibacteria group bacterium]